MDRENRRRVSVSLNIRIMMFSPHMFPLNMFFFYLQGTLINSDRREIRLCLFMFTSPLSLQHQHLQVRMCLAIISMQYSS